MLIIPYVCAQFHDAAGNPGYRITPDMLRTFQEAPDSVREDLLFDMLVRDGSIRIPETAAQRKQLEQDPMLGMNADGTAAPAPKPAESGKPAKAPKTKAETKPAEMKPAEEQKQ